MGEKEAAEQKEAAKQKEAAEQKEAAKPAATEKKEDGAKGVVDVRACVAEYFAMLLFVFICTGSATGVAGDPGWVQQVSLTFGMCITVLAYKLGHYSGSHINCAVTFGLALVGEVTVRQALANFASQLLGSVSGALLVAVVKSEETDSTGALGSNALALGVEWYQALAGEIICTFLLMGTVLETAVNTESKDNRKMAALAIGFSVYVAHSFMIPVDGCSINPTRSIGPALIATFRVDDASLLCKCDYRRRRCCRCALTACCATDREAHVDFLGRAPCWLCAGLWAAFEYAKD